jgi:hypothetical protein
MSKLWKRHGSNIIYCMMIQLDYYFLMQGNSPLYYKYLKRDTCGNATEEVFFVQANREEDGLA